MNTESVIKIKDLKKSYSKFTLDVPELNIPKGFATALIGENGAGKTTLIDILSGMKKDYHGNIDYFNGISDQQVIRESIGYTGATNYFLPSWSLNTINKISKLLFEKFSPEKFEDICIKLGLSDKNIKIRKMSDGMKMKSELATVFARETDMLILDEPASPLDPLMRDRLCTMIQTYLEEGNGERSVFFSTHNIADMENITDYAVIMEKGQIVEMGFVTDLKEKYILIKGETCDADKLKDILLGFSKSSFGCEGLCKASDLDKLAGLDIATATPTLTQICVSIMKQYTALGI